MKKDVKNGGIFEMDKEKALKNQGSEFREVIYEKGGLKLEMELSSIALVKDQLMRAHYRMLKLGNIVE